MTRSRLPLTAAVMLLPSLGATLLGAARGVRRSVGASPADDFTDSPQWRDGSFQNTLPAAVIEEGSRGSMARELATKGRTGKPKAPVHVVTPDLPETAAELAVTWLGHATTLVEIEGHWVLTDPVWGERVSPSATVGPRRHHPVPLPLEDLPRLDVVLVSHDHYDHLDTVTVDALCRREHVPVFVVPLGIGSHLRRWGVPGAKIVELDWGESHRVGRLTLTCAEARHFSGRSLVNNLTLWSSWVVAGERTRVYFGGDSGYTPAYRDIGAEHGPFDLTILPIGAYDARWRDVHMDPAEAVQAHEELRGAVLLPIHWATFDLAFHTWAAPVEWVREEAARHDVRLALPAPGQRVEGTDELPVETWWRSSA